MKQFLCMLMLTTSIKGALFAQQNNTRVRPGSTFELPTNYINRRFYFELGQGNEIQLGLRSIKDLDHIGNLDSLIRVCLQDLAPFKDSLSDELTSKKIDYTIDPSGRKEIRLRQYAPKGSNFLLQQGAISSLKLDQDTIHILAPVNHTAIAQATSSNSAATGSDGRFREQSDQFEVNIIVNELSGLPGLIVDAGIQGKADTLEKSIDEYFTRANWEWIPGKNQRLHLKQDPAISVDHPVGVVPQKGVTVNGDHLGILAAAGFQNYKNYFVPSFSLSLEAVFNSSVDQRHKSSPYKYDISLSWEPQFLFQNTQGSLQTFRNDFLTFSFDRSLKERPDRPSENLANFFLPMKFSIAYLINREGPYYDKNTFRLGVGSVSLLKNKLNLDPLIYFNNFFKGVTPGLRLQVIF